MTDRFWPNSALAPNDNMLTIWKIPSFSHALRGGGKNIHIVVSNGDLQ